MKRAALLALLSVLSAVNFYSAFSLNWSRRHFPLPFKSDSLRKVIHIFFGLVFVLCVLLLIYGAFMPTVASD
jgi:threonine/homoserine/homoserine lactone efflux protein